MVVQQLFQLLVSVAHPAEGKISRPHKLHLRQCLGNLRKLQHPFASLQLTGTDNGKALRVQSPAAAKLLDLSAVHR